MAKQLSIGLFGGTFDPVHLGHLLVADDVLLKMKLDKIIFIPSALPPHKQLVGASARHRLRMVRLAIQGMPVFEFSNIEIRRPGRSYSIETVMAMRQKYPGSRLYFIAGADTLKEIQTWNRADELLKICQFVVMTRAGYNLEEMMSGLKYPGRFRVVHVRDVEISSTDIRRRIQDKQSIHFLVTPGVERYLKSHKLYL